MQIVGSGKLWNCLLPSFDPTIKMSWLHRITIAFDDECAPIVQCGQIQPSASGSRLEWGDRYLTHRHCRPGCQGFQNIRRNPVSSRHSDIRPGSAAAGNGV